MEKKTKKKIKHLLLLASMMLVGALSGVCFIIVTEYYMPDLSFIDLIFVLILFYIALTLNTILHEAGHLVMGLLTGYKFSSFRIFNFMLLKTKEGYSFRKFSIPGTAGQCLLIPPPRDENGNFPNILYNLGGVMMNFFIALISLVVILSLNPSEFLGIFFSFMGIIALLQGIENSIPLGRFGITNDGANIQSLKKSPKVRNSLWIQLVLNALQTEGVMLQDMPDEYFIMPEKADLNNQMISVIAIFVENRLMEEKKFQEVLDIIEYLTSDDQIKIASIYLDNLKIDKIAASLMLGKEVQISKDMRKLIKTYSVFPGVIRTAYMVAKLYDKNEAEALKQKKLFDRKMKKYPFEGDRKSELEFICLIDKKASVIENP